MSKEEYLKKIKNAMHRGDWDVFKLLLSKVDTYIKKETIFKFFKSRELFPLIYETVIENNDFSLFKEIYENNSEDIDKGELLKKSIQANKLEMVTYLLEKDVNIKRDEEQIIVAAVLSNSVPMLELLVENGLNLKANDNQCVLYAISHNAIEVLEYVLNHCSRIPDEALVYAVEQRNIKMIDLLIKKGVNLDNDHGFALSSACELGFLEEAKFLIEHGATIDINKNYPLRAAAESEKIELVQYLIIEKNQDINIILNDKKCPQNIKDWANSYLEAEKLHIDLEKSLSSEYNINSKKIKI